MAPIVLDPGTSTRSSGTATCATALKSPSRRAGFYELKDVPHGNVLLRIYYAKTANAVASHLCLHAAGL